MKRLNTSRDCVSEGKYALDSSYKCSIKEHDELQKLPYFIVRSIKNINNVLEQLSSKNVKIQEAKKDSTQEESVIIDPVIRLKGKTLTNLAFHSNQIPKVRGKDLEKLTKKLYDRVIEVKNQL